MKRITITIPEELHQRVKAAAKERGISMSKWVREALEVYLQKRDRAVKK